MGFGVVLKDSAQVHVCAEPTSVACVCVCVCVEFLTRGAPDAHLCSVTLAPHAKTLNLFHRQADCCDNKHGLVTNTGPSCLNLNPKP